MLIFIYSLVGQNWDLGQALKSYSRLNDSLARVAFPSDNHVIECNGCLMPSKVKQPGHVMSTTVNANPLMETRLSNSSARPILHKANAINLEDDQMSMYYVEFICQFLSGLEL